MNFSTHFLISVSTKILEIEALMRKLPKNSTEYSQFQSVLGAFKSIETLQRQQKRRIQGKHFKIGHIMTYMWKF